MRLDIELVRKTTFFVTKCLVCINLSLFICIFSQPTLGQTLEQAITHTLKGNPEIGSSYNEFISKKYLHEASVGAYLPAINLDAEVGREITKSSSGNISNKTNDNLKQISASLTQLIWDGNGTINNILRTEADAESLRLQFLSDVSDKMLEVIKVYLDVGKAYEIIDISENNLSVHKYIYDDISKRFKSGIGSTADLAQIEARLAKAHSNLASAKSNLHDSQTKFIRVVDEKPEKLLFPNRKYDSLPHTLEEAIALAFQLHPVIQVASADVNSAKYQYEQSKGSSYPTISVEVTHTWGEDRNGFKGSNSETLAMLRLQLNLFNGGSDVANSQSFIYQLNKAKDLQEAAYQNVEESVRLSWSAFNLSKKQNEFLSEQVNAAFETSMAYEKQYNIGRRTLLDLLNTENDLFEARKEYLESKYSKEYSRYQLMNSIGLLPSTINVDMPEEWLKITRVN